MVLVLIWQERKLTFTEHFDGIRNRVITEHFFWYYTGLLGRRMAFWWQGIIFHVSAQRQCLLPPKLRQRHAPASPLWACRPHRNGQPGVWPGAVGRGWTPQLLLLWFPGGVSASTPVRSHWLSLSVNPFCLCFYWTLQPFYINLEEFFILLEALVPCWF